MFNKILIANRGEIACRIIRTAGNMGITTVAVYSQADRDSLHVRLADEAYPIGPAPARKSYLNRKRIITAARDSGAEAVHPGYGFLSENPEFARECKQAGLVFIGPPAGVIRAMGVKSKAKSLMTNAGIPVIPGYHGPIQDSDTLYQKALAIGFPLLIKADRGGGGKGIRLVTNPEEFEHALSAAQREASGAFADAQVILEKYLREARHIEVQIFRDTHGNSVHLFERDCSLQRRHQKIIEESPAHGLPETLRRKIFTAALNAAQTINYIGAGTVEFLVEQNRDFYFMEINTRLQVEHPVTEMITGQDLVEWQFLVASGEPLPCCQEEIESSGHAIEARVYAEDPNNGFLPSAGTIHYLAHPDVGPGIRLDSGMQAGDVISPYYDPILAKLIVRGRTRDEAVERLSSSLRNLHVTGIATNIAFLNAIVELDHFQHAHYDINTIDASISALTRKKPLPDQVLAAACLFILLSDENNARQKAAASGEPNSPWHCTKGYQLNGVYSRSVSLVTDRQTMEIEARLNGSGYHLYLPSGKVRIEGSLSSKGELTARLNNKKINYRPVQWNNMLTIFDQGTPFTFTVAGQYRDITAEESTDTDFRSPIPAIISTVQVTPGTQVKKGDSLLSLEAMKMEYTIKAPRDGLVEEVLCSSGEQVNEGDRLISFKPARSG